MLYGEAVDKNVKSPVTEPVIAVELTQRAAKTYAIVIWLTRLCMLFSCSLMTQTCAKREGDKAIKLRRWH